MKKIIFALICLAATLPLCSKTTCTQWSAEQARTWWDAQEWPVGCCYVPTYAVNQFEMWQADTFNPAILDREMGLCEDLGFNVVRVYLHEMLWFQDKKGFKNRIDKFLDIAHSHGIKVTFTFCTNGGGEEKLGKQLEPDAVHGGGHWVHSPMDEFLFHKERWPEFKAYVQDILRTYKNDSRILYWCLCNEPENLKDGRDILDFMTSMYQWAWEVRPSQPLTSPVWMRPGQKGARTKLDMVAFVCQNSDIITFHCYYPPEELETYIQMLSRFHRPMICQEYLARTMGCFFETNLPILKREKVGALNWGLAEGKNQYKYPWDWKPEMGEPKLWFHSIYGSDYKPFSEDEITFIKNITADKTTAGLDKKYPL